MCPQGFKTPDRPFSDALADAKTFLLRMDFSRADMAIIAFETARAAFPHSLHREDVGSARLVFDWIVGCNRNDLSDPAQRMDYFQFLAEKAMPEEQAFARQNPSLKPFIPVEKTNATVELSAPIMRVAA